MLQMNLMKYLLEYTLETTCHGNRSECARRLGMEYNDLKKSRNRINDGGTSNRVTEAILEMYWREHLSSDDVLRSYTRTRFGSDLEAMRDSCANLITSARSTIEDRRRSTQEETLLLNSAGEFIADAERYFCKNICQRERYQGKTCPIKYFLEYIRWLENEVSVCCNADTD